MRRTHCSAAGKSIAFPAVLCYNRRMNRPNFDEMMRAEMKAAPDGARLLLHSCCGPCSSRCIEELKEKVEDLSFCALKNLISKKCLRELYEKIVCNNRTYGGG